MKGCCFWGRGALLTKGVCNLGKFNYYHGADAAKNGMPGALFGNIDFCTNPGGICSNIEKYPTIVWDIAMFEWVERIQSYDDGNFNYIDALKRFVNGGMQDPSFIESVSNILVNGADTVTQ